MKKNIIIDCDPGHDDMLAIMSAVAHPEDLKVIGISTVFGNQSIDKVTQNALNIVKLLNQDIDVCKGAERPLSREVSNGVGDELHGESGLGGYDLEKSDKQAVDLNVVDFLYQKIMESDTKVTVVATGPLTNIAKLLLAHEDVKSKIEEISIMGGSLYNGNVTQNAEFNFWADPEAAKIVFNSDMKLVVAMLEATHKASLQFEKIEKMAQSKDLVTSIVGKMNYFHVQAYKELWNMEFVPVHDACSVLYLVKPELFEYRLLHADILIDEPYRGSVVFDERDWIDHTKSNIVILTNTNTELFNEVIDQVLAFYA